MLPMSAVIATCAIATLATALLAIVLMTAVLPPAPAHAAGPEAVFRDGLSAYNAGNYLLA